jgi:hypothetical protein
MWGQRAVTKIKLLLCHSLVLQQFYSAMKITIELSEFLKEELQVVKDWAEDYEQRAVRCPAKKSIMQNHIDKYNRIHAELSALVQECDASKA